MSAPLVTKFLEGKIGKSEDFTSVKFLKINGPEELGAIFAWKGEKPESRNRHVSIEKNPTLKSALENDNWINEAIALGDQVGLGVKVRAGLSCYKISESIFSSPADNDSLTSPSILYTPSCEDVNESYQRRCRPGEQVDSEVILDWVESDLTAKGKQLSSNWRETTHENCLKMKSHS